MGQKSNFHNIALAMSLALCSLVETLGKNPLLSLLRWFDDFSLVAIGLRASLSEAKQNGNHNYRKLTRLITWITDLPNSMKP